jgi:hypothetical protein
MGYKLKYSGKEIDELLDLAKESDERIQQIVDSVNTELEDAVAILAPTPDFSENFNNDFTI